jgi:hypothetical protein
MIKLYHKTYHLPTAWEQIPYKIHLLLAPVLLQSNTIGLPYAILCQYIPKKILDTLPDAYLQPIIDLLRWAEETPYFHPFTKFWVSKWSLNKYRIDLDKTTLFQLAYAHFYLRQLSKPAQFTKALDEIFFTLSLFDNDEEYTDKAKEENQKYYANKTTIIDRYSPKNQEQEVDFVTGQPIESKPQNDQYGYFPLILDVAQSGIYGNYETSCKIPAHTIFFNAMISRS